MSIAENKQNALPDDALSAVTGGATIHSFKTVDEINTATNIGEYDDIEVDGVVYHRFDRYLDTYLLYQSDAGARLLIPLTIFVEYQHRIDEN